MRLRKNAVLSERREREKSKSAFPHWRSFHLFLRRVVFPRSCTAFNSLPLTLPLSNLGRRRGGGGSNEGHSARDAFRLSRDSNVSQAATRCVIAAKYACKVTHARSSLPAILRTLFVHCERGFALSHRPRFPRFLARA